MDTPRPTRSAVLAARWTVLGVAVVGTFLAPTGDLQAQTIPSAYSFIEPRQEAGIFVGYLETDRGPLRLGPVGGPMIGARYDILMTGPLAFEVSGFMVSSEREVYDPGGTGDPTLLGTVDSKVAGFDARLRLTLTGARTWHGFAPFVLGGFGFVGDFSPTPLIEAPLGAGERFTFGPAPLVTAGGGTRWYPSEHLSVRLDGIFHLSRIPTPSAFLDSVSLADRRWARSLGFGLGVHFGF